MATQSFGKKFTVSGAKAEELLRELNEETPQKPVEGRKKTATQTPSQRHKQRREPNVEPHTAN